METKLQRIKIAEACGWSMIENANTISPFGMYVGYQPNNPLIGHKKNLPDYLNDLNAMAEAIKIFSTLEQQIKFRDYLMHGVGLNPYYWEWQTAVEFYRCVNATAAQRAKAFLQTLNLWEE